jgi:uncharacterized protein DUF6361
MPSSFTWLDHSEQDRRRALDVISLFCERDTRDDLGLGTIRDALSDLFSPGTTTIQTRVRYFLFIPWMYQRLERTHVASGKIAARARSEELQLVEHLARAGEKDGVIGIEARKKLKRLPSNVYWTGLRDWGIRQFEGSQDQYHRSLDRYYTHLKSHRVLKEDPEGLPPPSPNWHAHIPEPPSGFPENASLTLRRKEAEYLRDQILERTAGTLLAHIVSECEPWDRISFPWDHPEQESFPAKVRGELGHARRFSETMHGAALLYNLMLALKKNHAEWTDHYTERFENWAAALADRRDEVEHWDHGEFWQLVRSVNPRIPYSTESFVERWLGLMVSTSDLRRLAERRDAQQLVQEREWALKRSRARLQNPRQLELWDGAAGAAQLDFRWGITQRQVEDILVALHGEASDAATA